MNNEIKSFSIAVINDIPQEENMDFAICRIQALSDGYNTHKLKISNEVLKKYASTCLGKFVVAKSVKDIFGIEDFAGHEYDEIILGYIPPDAEIRFVENESNNGIFFEVDAVISKLYTNGALDIFKRDGNKSVSCEFTCTFADDEQTEIESFNIRGITILGSAINPSCIGANAEIINFSERAMEFYHNRDSLQNFTEENMTEKKSYKIDKSKESMSNKAWGDIDKTDLRNKVVEASNASTLVKSVYLLVEDGWKDAPSQHLKYPVMELKGDTFVYNRNALASAKAYAEKNNEQTVLDKLNKIYKKLELDKEDKAEMAEIKQFTAVDLENLWCKISKIMEDRGERWLYCIEGIYEDAGQKFVIVRDNNDKYYRADFSFNDDGDVELSEEAVKVEKEFIENGEVIKFEEPENVEQYKTFAEPEDDKDDIDDTDDKPEDGDSKEMACGEKMESEKEMSSDAYVDGVAQVQVSNEQAEKNEELAKELKEKEDIIMKYEQELTELRQFKADTLESQKMSEVNKLLAKLQGKIDGEKYEKIEAESKEIKFEEFSAWKNSVLASYAEDILTFSESNEEEEIVRMGIPQDEKSNSLWDRL